MDIVSDKRTDGSGEVGMIQIDMPMPDNCVECRFNDSEFGYCNAMPVEFVGQVSDWEEDGRPEWCPLKAHEQQYPVCERCGKLIDHINTSVFNYDGSDSPHSLQITYDKQSQCVAFSTTPNWTGYELSDEELKDDIRCPYCGEYPFDADVEIELYEPVEVMMWTSRPTDEQREATPWE